MVKFLKVRQRLSDGLAWMLHPSSEGWKSSWHSSAGLMLLHDVVSEKSNR